MRMFILAFPIGLLVSGVAVAQGTAQDDGFRTGTQPLSNAASNLPGQPQTSTTWAPSLPAPEVAGNRPSDFLRAAQGALAAGRTGEAQQAIEMAQTRMLARAVPIGQTGVPADNPAIRQASQALQALGAGDRTGSMQALQQAIDSAAAQGM